MINKIIDWCYYNWKYFAIIGMILFLYSWVNTNSHNIRDLQSPILNEIIKQQDKRISTLEEQLLKFNKDFRKKIIADSILYSNGQKTILEINSQIKDNKYENQKKHIVNSNTDLNQSFDILTNNLKKRSK